MLVLRVCSERLESGPLSLSLLLFPSLHARYACTTRASCSRSRLKRHARFRSRGDFVGEFSLSRCGFTPGRNAFVDRSMRSLIRLERSSARWWYYFAIGKKKEKKRCVCFEFKYPFPLMGKTYFFSLIRKWLLSRIAPPSPPTRNSFHFPFGAFLR